MAEASFLIARTKQFGWKRFSFTIFGLILFVVIYFSPPWCDAVDPKGTHFALSQEGKAALGLFLLAVTWWVFEVIPIGITAIVIGVAQALFLIRKPEVAFGNFFDPSVCFIFASLILGRTFTKSGLTQRLAYNMLVLVGERTSMIYLGCFALIALLTLVMAHTAVAATVFPLFIAIYSLYSEDGTTPTKFGKGLFIGLAYVAGASSIVSLLGAARGAIAIGFFKDIVGREVSFLEYSYYLAPLGCIMVLLLWLYLRFVLKPEKTTIPGLRERARALRDKLGPLSRNEKLILIIVFCTILTMSLRSFFPAFTALDKSAVILLAAILFFILKILTVQDLEEIPWNIVLLFGGAMSIGLCLWQTGAASWLAVAGLGLFQHAPGLVFVLIVGLIVLMLTNFIINVAAIAICLPISLVMAPYLGVAPEIILFAILVTAGQPFMLLIGAAPNAIASESKQFTSAEFFKYGVIASIMLMIVLAIFVFYVWSFMGMPVRLS